MATVARAGQDPAASISDANEDLRLYSMLGDIDLVLLMLVRGAHVDDTEPVEGNTALLEACRNGHTLLLGQVCCVCVRVSFGPVVCVCAVGALECVSLCGRNRRSRLQ